MTNTKHTIQHLGLLILTMMEGKHAMQKMTQPKFTYDGFGINDRATEYCERVAKFTNSELADKYGNLFAASPEILHALKGCRDMLRECAKMHRLSGNGDGHGSMADIHADKADEAIRKAMGE